MSQIGDHSSMAEIPTEEENFFLDLKVLVIDKDPNVLQIIEEGCTACRYQVITCSDFHAALNHVGEVDLVLAEVDMPNEDGYKFLQYVSKEVDIPIIAMSNDDSGRLRVKALTNGACDYIKKPLREEHFRYMWQPVVIKARKENKLAEKFGLMEDDDPSKWGNHDSESAAASASFVEATEGVVRDQKGSSPSKGSDDEEDDYCPRPVKKTRVIWSGVLHELFIKAVKQIGIDKAVPKKILEVMNVPGLTRENVASHLQKFRHQLKGKSDGMTRQQNGMMSLSNTIPLTIESRAAGASGGFDFQPLAGNSSPVPYHPEIATTLIPIEQNQWPNHSHAAEQGLSYDHPITKSPSNMSLDDESRYSSAWLASDAPMGVNGGVEKHGNHLNNVLMNPLQQQQSLMHHHSHINPASFTQNCSFSGNSVTGHGLRLSQSNSSLSENNNGKGIFHGYAGATPVSILQQGLTNVAVPVSDTQLTYGPESNDSLYHESLIPGYDGNKMYIPTKPAGFENETCEEDMKYSE